MDALAFYGLEQVTAGHWRMPVVPSLCSFVGPLYGGCGLGAAIAALEHTAERPLVWATAQFLEFTMPPDVVELEVTEVVRGQGTSQGRVRARVDGREIFTVLGALGRLARPWSGEWIRPPEAPPPEECPIRPLLPQHTGTIAEQFEVRSAQFRAPHELDGTLGNGQSALWVRNPWGADAQAASLAILGDYVPLGIGQAFGLMTTSRSLDNTLRMVRTHPTEWILADIRAYAVADGFGTGSVHLWAEDGALLATASQSMIVRWLPEPTAPSDTSDGGDAYR